MNLVSLESEENLRKQVSDCKLQVSNELNSEDNKHDSVCTVNEEKIGKDDPDTKVDDERVVTSDHVTLDGTFESYMHIHYNEGRPLSGSSRTQSVGYGGYNVITQGNNIYYQSAISQSDYNGNTSISTLQLTTNEKTNQKRSTHTISDDDEISEYNIYISSSMKKIRHESFDS